MFGMGGGSWALGAKMHLRPSDTWFLHLTQQAVKPATWPKWSQLSKADTKLMLRLLSSNPEDQISLKKEEWSFHTILPCPLEVAELEDQHVWMGWVLLRWMMRKNNMPSPEELGINCVDPILSKILNEQDDPYELAGLEAGIQDHWLESTKVHLCTLPLDPTGG